MNRNPVNVGHLRAPIETKEAAPVSLCPLEPRVCRAAAHREAGDAIDRDAVSADLDEARDGVCVLYVKGYESRGDLPLSELDHMPRRARRIEMALGV